MFGLVLSVRIAFITRAYAIMIGAVGGGVIGWIVEQFGVGGP